ncbi:MAG: hypothetical protein LBS53_05210 [Synergistaceae bacterium]|jgi:hypothetical protein|nr:hypothetical protein [Synergistaceae bacterium]
MLRKKYALLAAACLMTLICGVHAARASDRCDITFVNGLDEPITTVKILYDTPYDEIRPTSSSVVLPPSGEYRLGVQGVTLPTRIILLLPLSSYEFTDLSGLAPEPEMRLEATYEDGVPRLKREDDPAKSAAGSEHKFLTAENLPYAVDRDFLTDASTMEEVRTLVAETAADAEPPAADLDAILFSETFGERTTLYFPVFWTWDYTGYASATPVDLDDPDAGIAVVVTVPLPKGDKAEAPVAVDALMSDLRVDGYRPATFLCNGQGESDYKEINFLEGDGDKYDDQDVAQEHLNGVLEKGTLLEAEIIWVQEEAFEQAKAEGEFPDGPGVRVWIANGQFEALFLP